MKGDVWPVDGIAHSGYLSPGSYEGSKGMSIIGKAVEEMEAQKDREATRQMVSALAQQLARMQPQVPQMRPQIGTNYQSQGLARQLTGDKYYE